MPHDGAPWMVLRLIQLADDLPPHRLRDNSVHRVNDLVSNAQLPINRPSQRSRRVSRHRGSHAAFRSQIRSQHPRDVCQTRINRSGPRESRGDELLGHADGIRMDTAGPVTAAYDPCSHGSAAIV